MWSVMSDVLPRNAPRVSLGKMYVHSTSHTNLIIKIINFRGDLTEVSQGGGNCSEKLYVHSTCQFRSQVVLMSDFTVCHNTHTMVWMGVNSDSAYT